MFKNIKYLILTVILVCCQRDEHINYPEYYRNFNKINEYLNAGKIDIAVSKFDSISQKINHIPSNHLFKIARICAENNRCDLSVKYLKKSLQNGQEYGKGIGANKTIDFCKQEIETVLNNESKIHKQNFNYNYKHQIDSMFIKDQTARKESGHETMNQVDSMNMKALLKLIEQYGYPGEKIIGHESAFNAFIMLLHMDRDQNNQIFKPILDKAYNDGQLWPRGYAWIVDRRRAWGKEQLEPYYYHMPSKNYDNFNIEQINEVNRRRDSIGLEPK